MPVSEDGTYLKCEETDCEQNGMTYTDRKQRPKGRGGLRPGTTQIKPDPALKLAAWRWAIVHLANGDERDMFARTRPGPIRFGASAYRDLVPLLWEYFPIETDLYAAEYDPKRGSLESLISMRVTRMYHSSKKGVSVVGLGLSEHPSRWPTEVRARAEARLLEVGWPW